MINEIDLSEGWRLMELKDICLKKAEYGSGAKAIDFEYKKPRYVRITDIDDNGNLKKNNIVSPDLVEEKYFLEENDLLFARSGSVGKTYLYKKSDGLCQFAGYLIRFKPNPEIIDSDYLNYTVKSPHYWNWIESKKKTMTISNINAKQYSGLKIPVPPLENQKKIVEILEKAKKLKEWRAEADELADDYLESLYLNFFGNVTNNPKGWEEKTIEELCSEIVDCPHSTPKYADYETEFPCIRTTELKKGYINWKEMKYLDEDEYNERIKRLKPLEGDIVYGREGSFGEAARVPKDTKISLGQRVMLFRPNEDICNSTFLWALLRSKGIYYQAVQKTSGSTVGHVNIRDIKRFKAFCPPIELQNQFADAVKQFEEIKAYQSQSKQEIDNLFNTLMQKAFKGELVC
jgi:type I restriction enzyme S subunit